LDRSPDASGHAKRRYQALVKGENTDMKQLKLLGLAVIAAAALTALLGAGSASATVICSSNTTPCGAKNPSGTTYTASLTSGTEATLAAGFSTIKCTESSVGLKQTSEGSSSTAVTGSITALSFGGCNATVNVLSLGSGNVAWTSGTMNGSLTGSGTKVEIVAGTTKCFYGGEITEGLTVEGGAPATATAKEVKLARETGSSALCANPSKWNAKYTFNGANSTAYVAQS
jgi:hypothetical protein